MRGVTGKREEVEKWVEMSVVLENGGQVRVSAAVLPSLRANLILGMPFLLATNAVCRFHQGICETKFGPVELYFGERMKLHAALACAVASQLPEEERRRLRGMLRGTTLDRRQKRSLKAILKRHQSLWVGNKRTTAKVSPHHIKSLYRPPNCSASSPILLRSAKSN